MFQAKIYRCTAIVAFSVEVGAIVSNYYCLDTKTDAQTQPKVILILSSSIFRISFNTYSTVKKFVVIVNNQFNSCINDEIYFLDWWKLNFVKIAQL